MTCSLSLYSISLDVRNRNNIVKLGAGNRKTDKELTDLKLLQAESIIPKEFRLKGDSDMRCMWLSL